MEEPGKLQSMGSLQVRHDRATSFSLSTFMHWRRKWQPTPVFLPGWRCKVDSPSGEGWEGVSIEGVGEVPGKGQMVIVSQ